MIWYIDFIILKNNSNKILTKIKKIRFILLRRVIKIHVLVSIKELYLIKSWFCPLFVTILNIICTYGYFNTIQILSEYVSTRNKEFRQHTGSSFFLFLWRHCNGQFPTFSKNNEKTIRFFFIFTIKRYIAQCCFRPLLHMIIIVGAS